MTRPSRRELERALEDLGGDTETVREWVSAHFRSTVAEDGFATEFTVVDSDGDVIQEPDNEGRLCILETSHASFWVPSDEVPEWIDTDADLPVREVVR